MADFHQLAQAGLAAINEGRYDDAIEAFTGALDIEPDRPDMTNALGMSYLHRGEVVTAIPHLERAVVLAEPFSAPEHQDLKRQFHLGLASGYRLADRTSDAIRTLKGVMGLWPSHPEAYMTLGSLLLNSCRLQEGMATFRELIETGALDEEGQKAAAALLGSIEAFLRAVEEGDADGSIFLQAHQGSYKEYFDQVAADPVKDGWFAEAARMARPEHEGDEPKPYLADGARPYAMVRADLVNPTSGEVAQVYSDTEPMIVGVQGLEPLAQAPIMVPWSEWPFEVWVCTQCPWHWLQITIQFANASTPSTRVDLIDEIIGEWYLTGFNGDFGDKDVGRFHYITDPDPIGDRAISYVVDLGRAKFSAVPTLLKRLIILHDRHPIERVLLGAGHLPD